MPILTLSPSRFLCTLITKANVRLPLYLEAVLEMEDIYKNETKGITQSLSIGIKGESNTPLRQKEGVELDEEVFVGRGWELDGG